MADGDEVSDLGTAAGCTEDLTSLEPAYDFNLDLRS
jgi:hypothetical protein